MAPRFVLVPYEIPRRCVATYFPEANVLVPIGSVALGSNTPTSKAVIVSLAPTRFHDGGTGTTANDAAKRAITRETEEINPSR